MIAPTFVPPGGTVTAVDPRSSITPASNAWTAAPALPLMVALATLMLPFWKAKMPPLLGPVAPLPEMAFSIGKTESGIADQGLAGAHEDSRLPVVADRVASRRGSCSLRRR
jgi:hypothetical protein